MLWDRLATDLRLWRDRLELPVSLSKGVIEIKKLKSDLRPIYDRTEFHTRQPSEARLICKDLRPKEDPTASWVSLASVIDKFHNRFDD